MPTALGDGCTRPASIREAAFKRQRRPFVQEMTLATRITSLGMYALCAFVNLFITGCAAQGTKEVWWREEVRFSTGETIVLERGEKHKNVAEFGRPAWLFDEAWLEAQLPGVGRTRWAGALSPLVLDVTSTGDWYVLGVTASISGEREYGIPEGKRYAAFKLVDNTWTRVPFKQFPREFSPNLLGDSYTPFIEQHRPSGLLITVDEKTRLNTDSTLDPAYRRINPALGL